jgi:Ca2+ transporting ATPase
MDSGITGDSQFKPTQHFTMIFNVFVLMTLFNEINARKIHGERNVFKGLFANPIFYSIWIVTLFLQVSYLFYFTTSCWEDAVKIFDIAGQIQV